MIITGTQNTKTKRQNFGNITTASTQVLRFLNTSPAVGATFVDLGSMSAPRTIVDLSRNPDAGLETGIREGSGTANHALIGTYGLLASAILSTSINNKYGVKSNKVFANFDSIETMGSIWSEVIKNNPNTDAVELRKIFFEKVLNNVRTTAQNAKGQFEDIPIDKKSAELFVREITDFTKKNPDVYKIPKNLLDRLKSILAYSTTAESNYSLKTASNSVTSDLDTFVKTTFSLGKIFSEPKALEEFTKNTDIANNGFIKALKSSKLKSSLLGVAIGMAVGASIQPLNVWLTKKRTGKEGFVGVEGCKQDKSKRFKAIKTAAAGGFLAFAYSTIVDNVFKTPVKKQFSQLLNRLQFNGIVPSIPQFKAVYAFTIASRIMAARDKNELRESVTKDFLGFTNWLILGGFVEKFVAAKMKSKNLVNYDEAKHGKGLFKKLLNLKVKTHDEVLFEEIKKANINPAELLSKEGKMLSAKELIKQFGDKLPDLKSRLRGRNIAQISGYLYSAIVLGILIPKLNIAITNHVSKKHQKYSNPKPINSAALIPENGAFSQFEIKLEKKK